MLIKLTNFFKKTSKKKWLLNQRSNYLLNGKYLFSDSLKYAYLNEKITKGSLYHLFENDPLSKLNYKILLLKKLFFNKEINVQTSKKNKVFSGTIYFFSKDHKEYKIFDLRNKRVLSIFSNKAEYNKKVKNYKYFSYYFNIPKIVKTGENEVVEELITFENSISAEDFRFILHQIMQNYIRFFKDEKNNVNYNQPIYLLDKVKKNFI